MGRKANEGKKNENVGGNVYPSTENENCIVERPYEGPRARYYIHVNVHCQLRRPRSVLSFSLLSHFLSIAINAHHQ